MEQCTDTLSEDDPTTARTSWWANFGGTFGRTLEGMLRSLERKRSRQRLAELDDHLLKDIGITRAEAYEEWRKPFWRG
ncbi:MAG: DUF1127 domain-containing protein [Alphaproteobacteria bacterium]